MIPLLLLGSADNERSDIIAGGVVVLGVGSIAGRERARHPATAINALLARLENLSRRKCREPTYRDETSEQHDLFGAEQSIPVLVHHFAYSVLTSLLTTLGESRSMRPLIFPGPSTSSAMARAELRAAWRGRGAKAEAEARRERERTAMDFMMI